LQFGYHLLYDTEDTFRKERPEIETQSQDLSHLKIDWRERNPSTPPRRSLKRVTWILGGLLTIVGMVVVYRFFADSAYLVEFATVSLVNSSQESTILNASGYVVAQRQAAVASKGTGRLEELKVKEGDRVKKGEIVARLENADMVAILAQAKANLKVAQFSYEQAKAELNEATLSYERKKKLLESELIPRSEFDIVEARYYTTQAAFASAEASVKAAEAKVRSAVVDVENTYIRAPFDGTVLTKNAEVGEIVAPYGSSAFAKAAVVTIADMASLEVEADVSETNIEKIRPGQGCEIILDAYPTVNYKGLVETIVPTADRAKATVLTKIKFLNRDGRVLPEMSARVAFLSEPADPATDQPFLAVHSGAVVSRQGQKVAYLIQGERARAVPVEVGNPVNQLVMIKSGLKAGDRVVINPPEDLASGSRIQIQSK
jgi:RND family efflux transporter MFP subunit